MTLWKDRFNYKASPVTYDDFGDEDLVEWTNSPGNRERIENLKWARDHCAGRFKVIVATAKDMNAYPRAIEQSYPAKMIMRLTDLNENTGEFRAVMAE